jgi:uncharacterized membrane protein
MKQSRWKSIAAWTSLAALVLFILKTYGLLSPIGLTEQSYQDLTTLLFAVLTAFGIFNNPTDKDGF